MRMSCRRDIWMRGSAISATALVVFALGASSALARDISQSGEQKNMRRVGHSDLQGRAAYHPDFIRYPDGRVIAFVGTHSNTTDNGPQTQSAEAGQPGGAERNDDRRHHQSEQRGRQIPHSRPDPERRSPDAIQPHMPGLGPARRHPGQVYMMRNVQVGRFSPSQVTRFGTSRTSPTPTLVGELRNLRNTHKHWWECKTGIAYLPGSQGAPAPQWRQGQSMMIVDWKNPAKPIYLRTHGLQGSQPSGSGPVPPSLHGPISAYDHPNKAGALARAATADDVIGNRLYLAWGVGDDGVLQILDRKKLLPPPYGTFPGNPDDPSNEIWSLRRPRSCTCLRIRAATPASRCSGSRRRVTRASPSSRRATSCCSPRSRRPTCARKRRTGASWSM